MEHCPQFPFIGEHRWARLGALSTISIYWGAPLGQAWSIVHNFYLLGSTVGPGLEHCPQFLFIGEHRWARLGALSTISIYRGAPLGQTLAHCPPSRLGFVCLYCLLPMDELFDKFHQLQIISVRPKERSSIGQGSGW